MNISEIPISPNNYYNTILKVVIILLHTIFYVREVNDIVCVFFIWAIFSLPCLRDGLLGELLPPLIYLLYIISCNKIRCTIAAGFISCKDGFYIKFRNNGKKVENLCIRNKKTEESHSIRVSIPDQDYICIFTDGVSDIKDLSEYVCENIVIVGPYVKGIRKKDLIID